MIKLQFQQRQMKMNLPVRVFQILVYLLFPLVTSGNLNTTKFQPNNDTLSIRDLAQLNRYPKSSTKLSSVSIDPVVSYLNVQSGQTADLPISSQSRLSQRSDFTIMFWFKVDTLPRTGEFMQIFSIQRTLSCFIDSQPSIQCDSAGIEPLRVASGKIVEGKWNHLTVAFLADTSTGYMMLTDDFGVPAISYSKDASIIQVVGPWSACIGLCMQKRGGFVGGIREFLIRNKYILPEQAMLQKNEIEMYSQDIRGYYRFSYDSSTFFKDQFVSRTFFWRSVTQNQTIADWRGAEMIPANVCPRTFNYTELYRFDLAQQMRLIQLSSSAGKATKYSYQMSITFYKNSTSCNTRSIISAQNGCNLVLLEDVFMLYFQSSNSARFFFDATKNFYQTQSNAFFIPDNQWITVKLFMSQQSGYQIFVLDQSENILSQFSRKYDMQQQSPSKKLYLFQSLVGYASVFTLSEEEIQSPNAKFKPKSPLIKLDFRPSFNQNGQPSASIQNTGSNRQPTQLMFAPTSDLVASPFQPLSKLRVFDGITCNDGHQVLSFDNNLSYLNFTTSPLKFVDNTQNSSIEFWFKFQNSATYNTSSQLFQMIDPYVDPFEHNHTYWVIFLNNSALNIAPFGMTNINQSAAIVFEDFNLENEDKLGWWHIACTFQFNVSIQCSLSNSNAYFQNGYSMVNVVRAFPAYSLDAHFGYYKGNNFSPVRMLLKEVRIWKKVLSGDDVQAYEQLQIDPTYNDDLLVYLRLNSLKNAFFNLAQLNKINSFDSVGSYKMVSQVPDMTLIPITRYNEISGLLEFATEPQSHVVCPSYTYLKDELCYSEPVNQAVLAIFPIWDANMGILNWLFTLQYSSMVDNSFFDYMKFQWSANDHVLAKILSGNQLIQTVSSDKLRQESIYQVSASISNPAVTFKTESKIQFIPSSCQWFEVEENDATSAYQLLLDLPGQQDLTYSLVLRQSTDPSCNQRRFYNAFSSLSFEYFVSGSAQRVGVQPKANYTLSSTSSLQDVAQAADLKIDVAIPASELANLPTFTDVRILMSVRWTSSLYADVLSDSDSDPVFQHVLYTVNYQTPDSTLLTVYVKPKSSVVAINQTLLIDASNVTTRNIDMQFAIIAYSWQCPTFFDSFCKLQSGSTLALPWQIFEKSGAPFGEYLQFQATVALVKDNQVIFITTVQSRAMWYNIMKPEFKIDFRPNPILISNSQETRFTIVPVNFDLQKFQNFTIQWQVYGQLAGRQSISFQNLSQVMVVPQDSWRINSTYSISCVLTYTQSTAITTNNSFVVNIYGQPFGGLAYISPKQGYLGDTFFIYLQGWESYLNSDTIVYTVFTSLDELGNQIGQQLTQRPMFQNETFYFVSQSTFPLIVKISDITGEVTVSRVVGTIINGTNPALSQQSFVQRIFGGLGSRHLSERDANEFIIDRYECNFSGQNQLLNDILNQPTCGIQQIFTVASEIANSTCKEVVFNKTFAFITIYDALVSLSSPCKTQQFLLLSILDQAQQFSAGKGSLDVLSRAKEIQTIDSFSGTNLQIISKRMSTSHNDTFKALGINYQISEKNSFDWNEVDFNAHLQLIALQSSQFQSFAFVQIYDPEAQKITSISGNSGQITVDFDIIPELFLPNITVCAVVSLSWQESQFSAESCLTQLVPSSFQVTCTCNIMMVGDVVTLTRDYSRQQGSPVTFPNHQLVVFSSGISHIQQSSYIFITMIGSICLYGLVGFVVAWRMDKKDLLGHEETEDKQYLTALNLVATRLERPIPLVRLQMRELKSYISHEGSVVFHVARAIHPVVTPFTYYCSSQTRALRFSSYHSQVNTMVILILVYFGRHYRQRDHRFEEVLDLTDIQSVAYSIVLGSVFLIPTLSDKCNQLFQNRNESIKWFWLRGALYLVSFVLNSSIVIVAVYTAHQAPASNQYLIAMAIAGSLVCSVIFTNLARVFLNSFQLPVPISYLQSEKAKSVLKEIDCMRKIKQQLDGKSVSVHSSVDVLNTESELKEKQQTNQAQIQLSESGELNTSRGLNEGFRE